MRFVQFVHFSISTYHGKQTQLASKVVCLKGIPRNELSHKDKIQLVVPLVFCVKNFQSGKRKSTISHGRCFSCKQTSNSKVSWLRRNIEIGLKRHVNRCVMKSSLCYVYSFSTFARVEFLTL